VGDREGLRPKRQKESAPTVERDWKGTSLEKFLKNERKGGIFLKSRKNSSSYKREKKACERTKKGKRKH